MRWDEREPLDPEDTEATAVSDKWRGVTGKPLVVFEMVVLADGCRDYAGRHVQGQMKYGSGMGCARCCQLRMGLFATA
jgi:hypothetical protein